MIVEMKEIVTYQMSINDAVQSYIEANPETTKPTFLKMIGDIFTSIKGGLKSKKEVLSSEDEGEKKGKKGKKGGKIVIVDEDKPEKKLNAYQIFMKEQMPLLQKRENEKEDGEPKKKPRELMSEISELWKTKKKTA